MEEELISKKKLLNETGISYGQFYRWKRKGLIPGRWLIHKSTRTGQESFLPADKILNRIEKIKELKEHNTLNEIADLLSPELTKKKYEKSSLEELVWVDAELLEGYEEVAGRRELYTFSDLVSLTVLNELRKMGESPATTYLALKVIEQIDRRAYDHDERIILARKIPDFNKEEPGEEGGDGFCLVVSGDVKFDPSIEVTGEIELPKLVRELKLQLRQAGPGKE